MCRAIILSEGSSPSVGVVATAGTPQGRGTELTGGAISHSEGEKRVTPRYGFFHFL